MLKNVIINGDNIEEMGKIPNNSIDLIFADPPYWMRVEDELERVNGTKFNGCDDDWDNKFSDTEDYKKFSEIWLKECQRILKKRWFYLGYWWNAMYLYNRLCYARFRVLVY